MSVPFLADVVPSPVASGSQVWAWLFFFAVTLVVEFSVVAIAWRFVRIGALRRWFIGAALGNAVSHPIATCLWVFWIGQSHLSRTEAMTAFAILEVAVTLFEAAVYRRVVRCPAAVALLMSALANGVTGVFDITILFVR